MRERWHMTGSMTQIVIPDPSVVILVGAAGSGKSTFATRHFRPSEILSSDAMRALISGDEADQHATDAAFGRLHRELERRLGDRLLTVVDATNVERRARRALLARAVAAGVPSLALVLDLRPAVVLARNAARTGRVVDEVVVQRHLSRLRSWLDGRGGGPRAEEFDQVVVLRDPREVDEVRIRRSPP